MEGTDMMSDQSEHPAAIEPVAGGEAPPATRRSGRRAVMLGAAATGAGLAAMLAGGAAAEAAPDSSAAVRLGKSNSADATTQILTKGGDGLKAQTSAADHAGLNGVNTSPSPSGHGVYGVSSYGTGILGIGEHGNGVVGQTNGPGKSAVSGIDASSGGNGVFGQSATGKAVWGSSQHGTGVHASSEHGIALQVNGRARFTNSGVIVVPSGHKSVTHSFPGVSEETIVLATIQTPQSGLFIEGAQAGSGSFTLTFSKKTSGTLRVGWMLLS
jgi:hypothetical protein